MIGSSNKLKSLQSLHKKPRAGLEADERHQAAVDIVLRDETFERDVLSGSGRKLRCLMLIMPLLTPTEKFRESSVTALDKRPVPSHGLLTFSKTQIMKGLLSSRYSPRL